ncbi:hypothetical protein M438DRAFT_13651 [Aureobasidium pullulans EXF-150]|uniref:Uncharacterized protein n=1 Tax=Aureobasidium pullulans EXF-150 TaxID=1043002 RepID=A0A074YSC8_AURPU|nr:uncharacterized protein M438DRAFT_13651 [Aureobasidium pullulans EXF-150]KEQ89756.1 hypothetical protein M438DRAFT_13651 [Aureobasidium pullulans EXF-150]
MSRRGLMISEKRTSPLRRCSRFEWCSLFVGLRSGVRNIPGTEWISAGISFACTSVLCNEGNVIQKLLFFFAKIPLVFPVLYLASRYESRMLTRVLGFETSLCLVVLFICSVGSTCSSH